MKRWLGLGNFSSIYISLYEGILLAFSILIIAPYFILTCFNNPSIDDFSFAIKTMDLGFWQAQVSAYTIWNGRYFASFVLSAHPMVFESYLFYKVESFVLLLLTIHSLYHFIFVCFSLKNKILAFILAVAIAFYFLDQMPTLVQGIYWASGAMTYHLASVLFLYLVTNVYTLVFESESGTRFKKVFCTFLIIACCGSNESIMLVTVGLLLIVLAYYLLFKRTINKLFLTYFVLSLVCFLVLLSSPGGAIRETSFTDPNTKNVVFTIVSSFKTGSTLLVEWICSIQMLVFTLLLITCFLKWGNTFFNAKKSFFYFLLTAVIGYLIIVATYSPGFWATGRIAPDRAINCILWLFLLLWSIMLFFFSSFLAAAFAWINKTSYSVLIVFWLIGLLITTETSGNYYTAYTDLISGKAYVYNNENKKRVEIMKNANENTVCELDAFSTYPKSIFNDDLTEDDLNWWNMEYAKYYNRKAVHIVYKKPTTSLKYTLAFDDEASMALSNSATITDELFFSPPKSSALSGRDTYSATFSMLVKELGLATPSSISTLNVSAVINSQEKAINAVLVFSVTDTEGKAIYWFGKEIVTDNYPTNIWTKEEFLLPITKSSIMLPENKLTVYLWNRGNGKVYLDDLFVEFY